MYNNSNNNKTKKIIIIIFYKLPHLGNKNNIHIDCHTTLCGLRNQIIYIPILYEDLVMD